MCFDQVVLTELIYLLQLRNKGSQGTSLYAVTVWRKKGKIQINYILLRSYRIFNIYKRVVRV